MGVLPARPAVCGTAVPVTCLLTSFGGQALAAASAAAALLSARALRVPSAGGAARGRGGRCPLGRRADARFLCRGGGSGAGDTGGIGVSPCADPQPPELRGDPCSLLPCPARRRAARTLGRGQADVVAAAQAALLLAGALGIAPTPGSAVVGGKEPGVGRAEAGLPCRARRGVAAVSPGWLPGAAPPPSRPRRSRSPLGTAAPGTLGSASRLCPGSAAAAPPAGTAGLAPDPSAEGHGDCGTEPYRAPQLTGPSRPACPTLVLSAAQPRAPASAARLPIAAFAVAPAICPLLPGWRGRGDPCEADGWWMHVEPGMPAGPGHICPLRQSRSPTQLRSEPSCPGPCWNSSRGSSAGPAGSRPGAALRAAPVPAAALHGQSPSPRQLFPGCRSWGSVCPVRIEGSQPGQRGHRSGWGAVSQSPKLRGVPAALPFHFTRVPVPSLPALLDARSWGPGRAELPKLRGDCRPPHLGHVCGIPGCTAGDSTPRAGDSHGPDGTSAGGAAVGWPGQGWRPLRGTARPGRR